MIIYNEKNKIFTLTTKNSSYVFGVWNDRLYHLYYGKRIGEINRQITDILSVKDVGFSAIDMGNPYGRSSDIMPMEFPTFGAPDLRTPAFGGVLPNGSRVTQFKFESFKISDGKTSPKGLPSLHCNKEDNVQTLVVNLKDVVSGIKATLYYTVFEDFDAIAHRVEIENTTETSFNITNALSLSYDIIDGKDYDFLSLYGAWAREGTIQRQPLFNGLQSIDSKRGASSHNHNPFF